MRLLITQFSAFSSYILLLKSMYFSHSQWPKALAVITAQRSALGHGFPSRKEK
jgi:hypothetical protein